MRQQKRIFAVYAVVTLCAVVLAPFLVIRQGINGASAAYLCFMTLLMAGFTANTPVSYTHLDVYKRQLRLLALLPLLMLL